MKLNQMKESIFKRRSISFVFVALLIILLVPAPLLRAEEKASLLDKVPDGIATVFYAKDVRDGLKPFLKSDYYGKVKDLSLFEGPLKSDISAPVLSLLGDIEETTGLKVTLKKILFIVGDEAVFYSTRIVGGEAHVAVVETGWFKGLLIDVISKLHSGIQAEALPGFEAWSLAVGAKRLYYVHIPGYTVISDDSGALTTQWQMFFGSSPNALSQNPAFLKALSGAGNQYHVLIFHVVTKPGEGEKGIIARGERLLAESESFCITIALEKGGAVIKLFSPYLEGRGIGTFRSLGEASDRAFDFGTYPKDTAAIVTFSSFDAKVLYPHFYQYWFSDTYERMNYIEYLKKWRNEKGFDLEAGIIDNLGSGASFFLAGLRYEGRNPYPNAALSFGIQNENREVLVKNLSALFSYASMASGPNVVRYGDADIYYMGDFRYREGTWSSNTYIETIKTNPGFALTEQDLIAFRDFGAIAGMMDTKIFSDIGNRLGEANGPLAFGSLASSPVFSEAVKLLPPENYDIFLFVDGSRSVSLIETYIINLSSHFKYFLYQDAEKRFIPLLELTRSSFVTFYGGVAFKKDGISGEFKLVSRDIDN